MSWDAIDGVTSYEIAYGPTPESEQSTSISQSTYMDVTPGCGVTTYFMARSHGDGTRYAGTWGNWFADYRPYTTAPCTPTPEPTATPSPTHYAAFEDPPNWSRLCRFPYRTPIPILVGEPSQTVQLEGMDGSVHLASIQLYGTNPGFSWISGGLGCVGARVTNRSTPGAAESSWSGNLYRTNFVMVQGIDWSSLFTLDGNPIYGVATYELSRP